jgi:hypothetical protein
MCVFIRSDNIFQSEIRAYQNKQKQTPLPLVRKQTIPTERTPIVGEVSANVCEYRGVSHDQRNGSLWPLICFLDRG